MKEVNHMSKVAVVYWSATGNTELMAQSVLNGAAAAGAEADIFTAGEFSSEKAKTYDSVALGCPAMGAEELEDSEFLPMFEECAGSLSGKRVALFGSYGWGDGEWMRSWEESCAQYGISLTADSVICCGAPDEAGEAECEALGRALA